MDSLEQEVVIELPKAKGLRYRFVIDFDAVGRVYRYEEGRWVDTFDSWLSEVLLTAFEAGRANV